MTVTPPSIPFDGTHRNADAWYLAELDVGQVLQPHGLTVVARTFVEHRRWDLRYELIVRDKAGHHWRTNIYEPATESQWVDSDRDLYRTYSQDHVMFEPVTPRQTTTTTYHPIGDDQ